MTMNDEARAYFTDMGLTYADVRREDADMLRSMLDVELRKVGYLRPITGDSGQLSWYAGEAMYVSDFEGKQGMCAVFLDMYKHGELCHAITFHPTFSERVCISIGDGGALLTYDDEIILAEVFKDWCDLMAMRKQALEVESGEVGA